MFLTLNNKSINIYVAYSPIRQTINPILLNNILPLLARNV